MPAARTCLARGCAKGDVWVSECFGCVGAQFAARRSARMSAQDRSRMHGYRTRIRTCPRDYRIGGRKDGVAATLTNAVALLLGCSSRQTGASSIETPVDTVATWACEQWSICCEW